ncbi:MAG: hypothetical protein WC692_01920 [Erythrobacter sp.]|jgi:hypothetical protein
MSLPAIDLASLPGLEAGTGLYGSQSAVACGMDDRLIIIMVYVYDANIGPSTH